MSTFREKAEAQTEQVIGQMLGDELLVREGQARLHKAEVESGDERERSAQSNTRSDTMPKGNDLEGMKTKLVSDDPGGRIHVVILDSGEEAFAALTRFANEAKIEAASVTAIGAFEKATVGWFDFDSKTYKKIEVSEQCEVLSAMGDVAVGDDGKASLHIHIVLGLSDGSTRGGHLLAGLVRPTLEVVLTEVPTRLRRKKRADLGIALIDIG